MGHKSKNRDAAANANKPDEPDNKKIQAIRDAAVTKCTEGVNALLEKYDCILMGVPGYVPDGQGGWKVLTRVDVIYNPTK